MLVLGIDPGLRFIGFGLIDEKFKVVGRGIIKPRGESLAEKLHSIYQQFNDIIQEYSPDVAVIESTIYYRNVKTALTLGAVRGILLLGLQENGIRFFEVSPTKIKLSLTGVGRAKKEQLEYMVKKILSLKEDISSHESDALALSLWFLKRKKHAVFS